MKYKPTIGIEIHAELKTQTKMFCNSKNDSDEERPNVNICPVCMAHPGTLPVINKAAIRHVLRVGAAVGGKLADYTEFDRKNYFYPDLPKGYQISQYKYPLVSGGLLGGVLLTRIHLEEDTGSSVHKGAYSLVDFNRAGVPLMELVTEPVVTSAEEATRFAKELQLLLRCLGASDANMEKGQMRVEANISLSDSEKLGTKVEVKNINSFKAVGQAILYEIKRQTKLLEKKEQILQETRGWDENKGKTFSQRIKEESHDYRYFPDPDLPSLLLSEISEFGDKEIKKTLPELPWEKRKRYNEIGGETKSLECKLNPEHIEIFVTNKQYAKLFDETYKMTPSAPKLIASYVGSDIAGLVSKFGSEGLKNITPKRFAEIINMISENKISSRGAKDILAYIYEKGGEPWKIAEEKSLLQQSDESLLRTIVLKIVKDNPSVVSDYRGGKEASLQYLIGQGMQATKGAANPKILAKLFKKEVLE